MEQDLKRNYEYRRLPDNIRQIGEISGRNRIYIEDYVLTYIRKVFQDKQENSVVILIGCEGKDEAAGNLFLYGALEIPVDPESRDLQEEQWDMLFHLIAEYFPYGRIMGWGCGVGIWNSEVDNRVRKMQEEQFSDDGSVLFFADLSEREEKVFLYSDHAFEELSGYFVYYERNPQMQEYMLREQPEGEGFESDYEDGVTQSIRTVIQTKQARQRQMHYLAYGMACLLMIMTLVGGSLLIRSLAKINSLEDTIATLSEYVAEVKQGETAEIVGSQAVGPADAATGSPTIDIKAADVSGQPNSAQIATPIPVGRSTALPIQPSVSEGTPAGLSLQPSVPEGTPTALPIQSSTPEGTSSAMPLQSARNEKALPAQSSQAEKASAAKTNQNNKSAAKKTVTAAKKTSATAEKSSAVKQSEKKTPAVAAGGVERIKQTYIVRKGDTLSQIVWNQYHSFAYMDRVQQINQIEDTDRIYIGQCILLPDV